MQGWMEGCTALSVQCSAVQCSAVQCTDNMAEQVCTKNYWALPCDPPQGPFPKTTYLIIEGDLGYYVTPTFVTQLPMGGQCVNVSEIGTGVGQPAPVPVPVPCLWT